jgi:uncharacterized protein (TIGR03067 family)
MVTTGWLPILAFLLIPADMPPDRSSPGQNQANSETTSSWFDCDIAGAAILASFARSLCDGEDMDFLVGDLFGFPTSSFGMGRFEYARYSKYGIDLIFDHHGNLVRIRRIPPKIRSSLPENVKTDMKGLQGLWEPELRNKNEGEEELAGEDGPRFEFDGDNFTLYGGGVAPRLCYTIDPSKNPKTIHFYLPDPRDDAQMRKNGWPTEGIYILEGDSLTLRLGDPKDLKDFEDKEGNRAGRLRRVNLGLVFARAIGIILP